jgi:hypothetical protein
MPDTIYQALEAFRDADIKRYNRARCFLGVDWKTLRTESDFASAYDGYQCCVGLLPKDWHSTLKEMRAGLDSYVKARSQMTPDEWIRIVEEAHEKLLGLLRSHLSPEVWNAAGKITKKILSDLTER